MVKCHIYHGITVDIVTHPHGNPMRLTPWPRGNIVIGPRYRGIPVLPITAQTSGLGQEACGVTAPKRKLPILGAIAPERQSARMSKITNDRFNPV